MVAVEFDPFGDDYFNDPTDVYRRLRDEAPVYFSEKYGFYALSRFADVLAAHRDWETYSSAHGIDLSTLSKDSELIQSFKSIIMMDPPEHDRLRALVSRVFTPKAVTALEPMIREVICSFLEPLDDATEFDAVADFSANFPVEIIARLLGMPEADRQPFRKRLDISLHREHGQLDMSEENMAAVVETGAYFYELAVEKRKNPGDDMMSRLTQVTVDRGDGVETGLDDIEITGFAGLLGGAGAETVTKLVGNAVVLFARHQEQWQKILDDPEKIPRAVEEILRILPPSQYQGRFSVADRDFDGVTLPAGFPVLLITGAATRDPRAFEQPDEFDIERTPGISIGFGHGVHSCLGAALARMESRIALEEFARRWRSFEIDDAGLRRVHMSNVAGYSHVPVKLTR
jgi:cytochrome P450